MALVKISNLTTSTLGVGESVGSIPPRKTVELDLTVLEIESVQDSLVALEAKGQLSWSVDRTLDTADDAGEFLPVGNTATVTDGPLTLWVDASRGSDGNPGTKGKPLATLVGAWSRIPSWVAHDVVIRVSGGTYDWPHHTGLRVIGASVIINGEGVSEDLSSTPAEAGSSDAVVVLSGMTEDEYRGKTIEILTGSAAGDRRTVRNNTTTDIVPSRRFSGSVTTGDEFRIVDPAVTFNMPFDTIHVEGFSNTYDPSYSEPTYEGLWINNCTFNGTGVGQNRIFSSVKVFFNGVRFTGTTGSWVFEGKNRTVYNVGNVDNSTIPASLGSPTADSWAGWGISSDQVFLVANSNIKGIVVASALYQDSGVGNIFGGNLFGAGAVCRLASRRGPGLLVVDGSVAGTDIPVLLSAAQGFGTGTVLTLGRVEVNNPSGDGVTSYDNGLVAFDFAGQNITASAIGLYAYRGGRILFADSLNVTAATETQVDDAEGTPITRTIAGYTSDGMYISAADGSVIQRK